MTTTGYTDTFGRTVAGGLGVATSGQTYTMQGASQFSVAPNTGSVAMNAVANFLGYVDRQSSDIDISGQVALSAIPTTNLSTVGFSGKQSTNTNYYIGTMKVVPGGAVAIRFSKVVGLALVTLSDTTIAGLTYVAGTYYNLRFQCYWSQALQTNLLNAKLWAVGSAEPGGWMATITDNAHTPFTAGTQAGLYAREEQTTPANTARWQNVAVRSYSLPMPASTDTMCADPAIAYPKQTALQSLAAAADTVMATIDPLTSLAALFPRVRVSATSIVMPATLGGFAVPWGATEFNIGTATNLGYDNIHLALPVGIWFLAADLELAEAASNTLQMALNGYWNSGSPTTYIRSNAVQSNDQGMGGTGHISAITYSTDPAGTIPVSLTLFPTSSSTSYTIKYCSLTAIKISDYFV